MILAPNFHNLLTLRVQTNSIYEEYKNSAKYMNIQD